VALEDRVLADVDLHVKVTGGAAVFAGFPLAREPDAIAVVDAGRNLDRQRTCLLRAAMAPAGRARRRDDGARAATMRAGLLHLQEALLHAHDALTFTRRALIGLGAGLGAAARAFLARDHARHADLDRRAEHR